MITFSVDATLLDKARFKKVIRQNGKEAIFIELVMFESKGQYGDWIVKQQCTKEEREARLEMPILGNGKNFGTGSSAPAKREAKPVAAQPESDGACPF